MAFAAQASARAIHDAHAPMSALPNQMNAPTLDRPASFVALASVPTVIAAPDARTSSATLAGGGATLASSDTPLIAIATVPTTVWIPGPVAQRAGANGVSATGVTQDSTRPIRTTARATPAPGKLLVISAHHARLRAAPDVSSRDLLRLEQGTLVRIRTGNGLPGNVAGWVPVVTGNVEGWIAEAALAPSDAPLQLEMPDHARRTTTAIPVTSTLATTLVPAATAAPGHLRVGLAGLALRAGPDTKARSLTMLAIGTLVEVLPEPTRGPWTAISARTLHGWVPTRWLMPDSDLAQR